MMQISEIEAFRACRVLFGGDLKLNRDFLYYLQPSGAHSAFRKMAKFTHPDSGHLPSGNTSNRVQQFQDLNQAHQLIQTYLRQRDLIAAQHRTSTATRKPRPTTTAHQEKPHTCFAQGPLPTKPLQFGIYLYYRGVISFSALIGALTWQRQQRPTIGQIAQRWGWLEEKDIDRIIAHRSLGRFGERAEQLGLLNAIQVRAILLHQRTRQNKLGNYFIEQGLLTPDKIEHLLYDLSSHNLKYRHGYAHHFYYHR